MQQETPVYRIVYKFICPRTRQRRVEYGPWHPERDTAQRWIDYLDRIGHESFMEIEEARYKIRKAR